MQIRSKPLRIAVVGGSGLIGKRHCQHVASNYPTTELVAIVDPSPAAAEIAKTYDTTLYPTVDALLDSPNKPDAAIVCTPNHTHVSLCKRLAEGGVAGILCEKPISTTIDSARSLIQVTEEKNVRLLVGHHRRFNPYMMAAKRIVDSGVLGEVTAVSGLWTTVKPDDYFAGDALSWRKSKSRGGGVILINFIHEIDLMHYLFGPVTRIHAEKTTSRRTQDSDSAEEGAAITMRFASGVLGTFIISDNVASPHSFEQGTGENPMLPASGADVYRILGTKGTLSFPDMILSTYEDGETTWLRKMISRKVDVPNLDVKPFDSQLRHFAAVCRGTEEPSCSGVEGMRALIVCKAIREAISNKDGGGTLAIGSV